MAMGDFSEQAEAYEARPGYPEGLLDRLIAEAGVHPGDAVGDVGAGTGIFSRQLAARGFVVTAVEPNAAMRDQSPPGDISWVDGTFEATGLPPASQAWVTAAQAFHWADLPRAVAEIHRILRPGGAFTALWNDRIDDGSPVISATFRALRLHVPEYERYRDFDWPSLLRAEGRFHPAVYHEEMHAVRMDRSRYLRLWSSVNRLANLAGPDARQAFLRAIEDAFEEARISEVNVPYRCRSWTLKRVT